jgi:hypothetical protein
LSIDQYLWSFEYDKKRKEKTLHNHNLSKVYGSNEVSLTAAAKRAWFIGINYRMDLPENLISKPTQWTVKLQQFFCCYPLTGLSRTRLTTDKMVPIRKTNLNSLIASFFFFSFR